VGLMLIGKGELGVLRGPNVNWEGRSVGLILLGKEEVGVVSGPNVN
jgi:hypothetical protein